MLDMSAKPHLPKHVVLRHDKSRDRWVLLAPERVLTPDAIAVDVLKLCDGARTVDGIVAELAREYQAPAGQIAGDVVKLLTDLKDKGIIVT